jgi:hypothetical protein
MGNCLNGDFLAVAADDFEAFRSFFKHWQKAVGKAGCP